MRLGFAGGGTDISPFCDTYGGFVLSATIDMFAYCTIAPKDDGLIKISMTDCNHHEIQKSSHFLEETKPSRLIKGVYNEVVKLMNNGEALSFEISTYSDAPIGSGLGSSSTMIVAILKCFSEWLNYPFGDYELAQLAYRIEREHLCLKGGRQDQYAAAFGGLNFIEFYDNNRTVVNPLRVKNWIINELESSLVLYYTGASRESAKIIARQSTEIMSNPQALASMKKLRNSAVMMKESLLKGNIYDFAIQMKEAWEAKKGTAKEIASPAIDEIYEFAMESGAYTGKVSGAGGGGFMMFLVEPTKKKQLLQKLSKKPGLTFSPHFTKHGVQAWAAREKTESVFGKKETNCSFTLKNLQPQNLHSVG